MHNYLKKISHYLTILFTEANARPIKTVCIIFLIALALRSIMPSYLLLHPDQDPFLLMLASKHRYLWKNAMAIATGQWEFSTPLTLYHLITAIPLSVAKIFSDSITTQVSFVQIFQGLVDSLGCFVVFAILGQYFSMRVRLAGALLYAIWAPSIFYSYHILDETYTPILVLSIGYSLVRFINTEKIAWLLAGGALSGVLFTLRIDNGLLLVFAAAYIFWIFRKRRLVAAGKAVLLLGVAMLTTLSINSAITKTLEIKSTVYMSYPKIFSACFFNALGEYPATYKGLRFFDDAPASAYAQEELKKYNNSESNFILRKLQEKLPEFSVYVREVILDKPFLYADWLIRRFFVYLPSHPYLATITYYLSAPGPTNEWWTMRGYRFSQVFHGMKYLDYLLFAIAVLGVWKCRDKRGMMVFVWIYLGILSGHVITQCGEAYFRNDLEEIYLNPKYLLGMISIYPIFLAVKLDDLFDKLFDSKKNEMLLNTAK